MMTDVLDKNSGETDNIHNLGTPFGVCLPHCPPTSELLSFGRLDCLPAPCLAEQLR